MTTDNKTLADVQPGGRVRLGGELPPLPYPNYPVSKTGLQNNAYTASQMWDYAIAALSAQPSPGGQDAQRIVVRVPGVGQCTLTVNDGAVEIPAETVSALAARQPVGEAVAWLVHWSDMPLESPEVTRSASRITEVSALTNPPRIEPLYAAPAQAGDLGQFRAKVAELLRREFDLEIADPEDHRHDDGSSEADQIAGRIVALLDSQAEVSRG